MGCAASSPADPSGAAENSPPQHSTGGGAAVGATRSGRAGRLRSRAPTIAVNSDAGDGAAAAAVPSSADPSDVWLPELVYRYAQYLPHNEVPCTLRLVNKATAQQFAGKPYTTVRASEAVPHQYFVRCWGNPGLACGSGGANARDGRGEAAGDCDCDCGGGGGHVNGGGDGDGGVRHDLDDVRCNGDVRRLTWLQRMTLLARTAASGSIPNLEALLAQPEHFPPHAAAFAHAAYEGQLQVCSWLRRRGFPWSYDVGYAAAQRGDAALAKWAVENGRVWLFKMLCAAAAAGHVGLYLWILERIPKKRDRVVFELYESVAQGCDLATLQHLETNPRGIAAEWVCSDVTAYAAASPTRDWAEKVAWLEDHGHGRSAKAAEFVAERVWDGGAAASATTASFPGSGLEGGHPREGPDTAGAVAAAAAAAASDGSTQPNNSPSDPNNGVHRPNSCVGRLAWLQERGYPMTMAAARVAARVGNLAALQYLLGPGGVRLSEQHVGRPLDLVDMACAAARGGHLRALQLLHVHGASVTQRRVLGMAVLGGSLPLVTWLVEQITERGGGGGAAPAAAEAAAAAAPPPQTGVLDPSEFLSHIGAAAAAGEPTPQAHRTPQMCPALAAAFADSGVAVPELVRELAVLAVMSGSPLAVPRLPYRACALPPQTPETDRLELLSWLYDRGLAELHVGVFKLAAQYGNFRLMTWLYDRGCPWDARVFAAAAYAGGEAHLEWLARHGCPMGDDGEPYIRAAAMSDLATLRCLRRLGCPWSDSGDTFTHAAVTSDTGFNSVRLSSLQALLEVGCPVDWRALQAAVKDKEGVARPRRQVLKALLAMERTRRWRDEGRWPWARGRGRTRTTRTGDVGLQAGAGAGTGGSSVGSSSGSREGGCGCGCGASFAAGEASAAAVAPS